MAAKLAGLRIFNDSDGKMNLSIAQVGGQILLVSQFTLFGDVRRGMRPSFTQAAGHDLARRLLALACDRLREKYGIEVHTGVFGAHMDVELANDGPVTVLLDSSKSF
jgi:D-tyrosyl-tRNA(Tyr) deacylase